MNELLVVIRPLAHAKLTLRDGHSGHADKGRKRPFIFGAITSIGI